MVRGALVVCALLPWAFTASLRSVDVAAIEAQLRDDAAAINAIESANQRLVASVDRLRRDFESAQRAYAASRDYRRTAAARAYSASEDNRAAAQAFEEAEREYRQAAMAIVAVAGSRQVCASKKSTSAFRREVEARGGAVAGMDVDHLLPRSLGGVDHPLNYQMLDASTNRSLGNDLVRKLAQAPLGVVVGMAASGLAVLGGCVG